MLFDRYPKYDGYVETPRKRAAALRGQRKEQERLPLFAEQIAEEQPSIDEVMDKCRLQSVASDIAYRKFLAKSWRAAPPVSD